LRLPFLAAVSLTGSLGLLPSAAQALCSYGGELYAKTTLSQEFRDSNLVVRGQVVSEHNWHHPGAFGDWGTLYRVKVLRTLKGSELKEIRYYSERNSGGFYLDRGKVYLLFLDVARHREAWEPQGAYDVNYSCGQSQEWSRLSANDIAQLTRFSRDPRLP
jgi:hypothetical protein